MEVMSQRRLSSALNPNAPMFVPVAYRAVEDYSEQWWSLVQSSPWFRDYWLQERFQDPQLTDLDDIDALFDNFSAKQDDRQEENKYCEDLISIGAFKWRKGRPLAEAPKYAHKAPKIVSPRVSPRTIQQPSRGF